MEMTTDDLKRLRQAALEYYMRCPTCGAESSTGHVCSQIKVPPDKPLTCSTAYCQCAAKDQRIAELEARLMAVIESYDGMMAHGTDLRKGTHAKLLRAAINAARKETRSANE